MESNNTKSYNVYDSMKRLDDILNSSNGNFSDKDSIPIRSLLTYTNGFYVNVTSVFIDIVGSSDMTDVHKRPTLAKMYRSFISESVAILNSVDISREINIHGDCVWGVFDTPYQSNIDTIIDKVAEINSMVRILNDKLSQRGYSEISIGIGVDYGRALMIKAGYSGSGINDVIWMGDVVNSASNLCSIAGRDGRQPVVISKVVYDNCKEEYKTFFQGLRYDFTLVYETNIIDEDMENWYFD